LINLSLVRYGLEGLVLSDIKAAISADLNQHQFAYYTKRATDGELTVDMGAGHSQEQTTEDQDGGPQQLMLSTGTSQGCILSLFSCFLFMHDCLSI